MDVICAMVKLKPGCVEIVKQWAKTMNDRKDEALQTLVNEGVEIESVFLTKIDSIDYLVYYMRAKDMEKAKEVTRNSLMEIDKIHQKFKKDCWEIVSTTKLLLDISTK